MSIKYVDIFRNEESDCSQKIYWGVRDTLRDHQQARHQDRGGEEVLGQGKDKLSQGE